MPIAQSRPSNSASLASEVSTPNSVGVTEETKAAVRPNSSKRRLGLAATGVGLLLAGTAAGAYLVSNQRRQGDTQSVAVKVVTTPTPTPTLTSAAMPKPVAKPKPSATAAAVTSVNVTPSDRQNEKATAKTLLAQAQALEDKEQYGEAMAKYREYQQSHPDSADAGLVTSKIATIKSALRILSGAQADMDAQRYFAAREKYKILLQMKPSSKIAQTGFDEANAKLATMPPPGRRQYEPGAGEPPRRRPENWRKNPRPPAQPEDPARRP